MPPKTKGYKPIQVSAYTCMWPVGAKKLVIQHKPQQCPKAPPPQSYENKKADHKYDCPNCGVSAQVQGGDYGNYGQYDYY